MRFPVKITSSCIWVAIPVDWVILHWYACGADGRSVYVHVITTFSYPWCFAARASGARAPLLGSLSSDVFERRTSTGSDPFSLLISLDATIFVLPSVLILTETICPKICSKSRLKSAKSPFPVDVRRSKTSLLKLPNRRLPRRLGLHKRPVYMEVGNPR